MSPIRRSVIAFFAAFVVHDAEELVTMAPNASALLADAPDWVPISAELRRRGISQRHVSVGISVMTVLTGFAALRGMRTNGRSAIYRGALFAYGLHGVTHIGSALALRRYTSGAVTSPIVVIPLWVWASRVLKAEGLKAVDSKALVGAFAVVPILAAVHVGTRLVLGDAFLGPVSREEGAGER